jgi:hypothetical protein
LCHDRSCGPPCPLFDYERPNSPNELLNFRNGTDDGAHDLLALILFRALRHLDALADAGADVVAPMLPKIAVIVATDDEQLFLAFDTEDHLALASKLRDLRIRDDELTRTVREILRRKKLAASLESTLGSNSETAS